MLNTTILNYTYYNINYTFKNYIFILYDMYKKFTTSMYNILSWLSKLLNICCIRIWLII